jgi:hypothetical protein
MIAVPIISNIPVMGGPVSTEAYKYVPSVIVRIYISYSVIRPAAIIHWVMVSRPDNTMAESVMAITIMVNMPVTINWANYPAGLFITPDFCHR